MQIYLLLMMVLVVLIVKRAASRIKTYVGASSGGFAIDNLDIDGGTDIGADLVDADEIIVDDGGGGTNRRSDLTRVKKYISLHCLEMQLQVIVVH